MKKLLVGTLVMAGALCHAMEHAEFNIYAVPQLNPEKMIEFKKSLGRQMSSVNTTKLLVYGALAAGAVAGTYRYFFSTDNSPVLQKDHNDLLKRVHDLETERDGLKGRVSALETANPAAKTEWMPWLTQHARSAGRTVGEWIPTIAKMWAYSQIANIIWRQVPTVDGYMALNPTINWCMLTGTPFIDSVGGFITWYQALHLEPGKHFDPENLEAPMKNLDKKGFAICCRTFVSSMEQVLGYMDFVKERLNPKVENYLVLKARCEVSIEGIAEQMSELIEMMNAFLQEDEVSLQVLEGMMQFWQAKVFLIISQLENFEPVTIAAGFKERDGKGRFNDVKRFILPQLDRMKPEAEPTVGPMEEIATDVVSQVAQTFF